MEHTINANSLAFINELMNIRRVTISLPHQAYGMIDDSYLPPCTLGPMLDHNWMAIAERDG